MTAAIPVKFWVAVGVCVALIFGAALLVGAHREFAYRLRRWRRGGFLIGGGSR